MSSSLGGLLPVFAAAASLVATTAVVAADRADCPPWPNARREIAQLRDQLCASDVNALEKYFSKRVQEYEEGRIDGEALYSAFIPISQPYPYDRLQAWIERYPRSYAAHIGVAKELLARAMDARGGEFAKNTPTHKFDAMKALLDRAEHYLNRSLALSRKPYLTYHYLIVSGIYTLSPSKAARATIPRPQLKTYLDKAIEIDGAAYLSQSQYMRSLQTRWGGSVQAMQAHLERSKNAKLTQAQFDYLRSMVAYDQAWLLDPEKHADERLKLTIEANKLSETFDYLRDIIWLHAREGRYAEALPYADRAVALNPGDAYTRCKRGNAYFQLNRHAEAYKDYLICAESGDAFAQNKIGYYLSMGIGVPQDKRAGAKWFAKSAAGGDKDGIANLARAKAEGSI